MSTGEGFREAFSGKTSPRYGKRPASRNRSASITLVDHDTGRVAVIESADAVAVTHYRIHRRRGSRRLERGRGELILAAAQTRRHVGIAGPCGSATVRRWSWMLRVLVRARRTSSAGHRRHRVTARFSGARRTPSKRASEGIWLSSTTLAELRSRYLHEQESTSRPWSAPAAAGGIPGALTALGASLVGDSTPSCKSSTSPRASRRRTWSSLGEGRFDEGSLEER